MVLQHFRYRRFGAPDNETVAVSIGVLQCCAAAKFLECGVGRHNFVKYDKCGGHFGGDVGSGRRRGVFAFFTLSVWACVMSPFRWE